MITDNIVIVLSNCNYKAEYAEKCPFKAKVQDKDDLTITVKSLKTGKVYELYSHQVLEAMDIEDITRLIDMRHYGV